MFLAAKQSVMCQNDENAEERFQSFYSYCDCDVCAIAAQKPKSAPGTCHFR